MNARILQALVAAALAAFAVLRANAAQSIEDAPIRAPLPPALSERDSERVKLAVDRGLVWLASQADEGGSFSLGARPNGQPALTALSIMAFLSRGHRPIFGPYGKLLNRAIDFCLSCQKQDGFICYGTYNAGSAGNASDTYNHAITMLMLGEVYGLTDGERSIRVRRAIEKGLAFTHQLWTTQKNPPEVGGWRYLHTPFQSDLSVTGWYVASLRSIKNAGFDVPKEIMDRVSNYVVQCYVESAQTFTYRGLMQPRESVAMTGAGILSLALAGKPDHPYAISASQKLVRERFFPQMPRCYYACYYATQAAAQESGNTWVSVYRNVATFLLPIQLENGQWPPLDQPEYGSIYSTSLAVLSLTPHFQLLPIYQH
jgi:hypothetical protein